MFFLWAVLVVAVLFDSGVLATTPDNEIGVKVSTGLWFQQIIDGITNRTTLYFGVATMAFIFFYKQNEIMTWLEIHAPF
jgi:hypothetical protein